MKKRVFTSMLCLLNMALWPALAPAQTTDDAPRVPATPTPSDQPTIDNREGLLFTGEDEREALIETAQGSLYDRTVAEFAVQRTRNKSVQRYALRLMDDHNKLNKRLLMQANRRGLELPMTLADEDREKLQRLSDAADGDFDVAYLQEAIRLNTDDVLQGNAAIEASSDGQFRDLMRDFVNTEQNHLNKASQILAELQRQTGAIGGKGLLGK